MTAVPSQYGAGLETGIQRTFKLQSEYKAHVQTKLLISQLMHKDDCSFLCLNNNLLHTITETNLL